MATVYAAFDHQLGREVAVKHLRGDDPRLRLRFAREARLVAALRHAGIVTIYDVDPDGEYLIAELVDGGSVAERLAARRVTPTDARRWPRRAAGGAGGGPRRGDHASRRQAVEPPADRRR
ncbi:MAG: hypothetical protein IPH44_31410 [Myxococcales bacterium]|nr:hypothetical protein [Myxococcales bacterium]